MFSIAANCHVGMCVCQVYKVRSKEDGKLYAVKRSREKFKGESDRCVVVKNPKCSLDLCIIWVNWIRCILYVCSKYFVMPYFKYILDDVSALHCTKRCVYVLVQCSDMV